jgi:predicted acetyltransferase
MNHLRLAMGEIDGVSRRWVRLGRRRARGGSTTALAITCQNGAMNGQRLSDSVTLVAMSPGRGEEFGEMLEEFRVAGELDVYKGQFAVVLEGYEVFYSLLSKMKAGGYPTPEIVPMDSYFIEAEGRILGELYIRYRLAPRLEKIGGHIGYKVRPSCRNQGVATAALKLALVQLDGRGVERALVTCRADNYASARVIEKCGGIRISDAVTDQGVERRYWIATASAVK